MTSEPDESRLWKYQELPYEFQRCAGEIDLSAKQHIRIVEKLAKYLARQRPKAPEEFERVEYLKDFCVKSAQMNDQTITLLAYLRDRLNEIYKDYNRFSEGAKSERIIRDQDERLRAMAKERDELQSELYELRKQQLRRADQAAT